MQRHDEQEQERQQQRQRRRRPLAAGLRRSTSSSEVQYTPPGSDEEEQQRIRPGGTTDPKPPSNPRPRPKPSTSSQGDYRYIPEQASETASSASVSNTLGYLSDYHSLVGPSGTSSLTEGFGRLSTSDPGRSLFQVQDAKFFEVGRVFVIEDNNESSGNSGSFGRLRRYVVVREPAENVLYALPITTHENRGVAKRGVLKANHGIIYHGSRVPVPRSDEHPVRGEDGMVAVAIRVNMANPSEKLDPMSRLDYGSETSIHVGTAVHNLGMVHRDSMHWLLEQFQAVQERQAPSQESTGDDEDEDDDDEDEDEEENPQREQSLPARAGPSSSSLASGRQPPAIATEALQAQAAYQRMRSQGMSQDQAINLIAQNVQQTNPGMSWTDAVAGARGRLRYRGS